MFPMPRTRRKLDPNEQDAAERLRAIWLRKKKALHLTQELVAADCGWTQGAFGHYLHGRVALNIEAVLKIARVLEVNPVEISPQLAEILPETHLEVREPGMLYLTKIEKSKKLSTWMRLGEEFDREGMLDVAIRSNKPLATKLRKRGREAAHQQTAVRKKAV